jgi:uncharacterized protein YijF (DUF1287 family)
MRLFSFSFSGAEPLFYAVSSMMTKIARISVLLWVGFIGNALADRVIIDYPQLINSARSQIGITTSYDPSYRKLSYPGGDVDFRTGVCTDVLIRALREQGIDLQLEVHKDMGANFDSYPARWGLDRPDRNIDHRRVANLMTFFDRQASALELSTDSVAYRPGDLVAWDLGGGVLHIGIVSDLNTEQGTPLIIHNIGAGTKEEDILFEYRIIGHYRLAFLEI